MVNYCRPNFICAQVSQAVKPDNIIFVMDASIGQACESQVSFLNWFFGCRRVTVLRHEPSATRCLSDPSSSPSWTATPKEVSLITYSRRLG